MRKQSKRKKRFVAPLVHRLSRPAADPAVPAKPLVVPLAEVKPARAGLDDAKAKRAAVVNEPAFWRKVWSE